MFLLAVTAWERGFSSDFWLTFRQAKQLGGAVKKGEKSSLVTFWKLYDTKDKESGDEIKVPVLRHYNVFNALQCEGITAPDTQEPDLQQQQQQFEPLQAAEAIVSGYAHAPIIEELGNRACYQCQADRVLIPPAEQFESRESRYATLFHELVHSTGHSTRLDRGLDKDPAPFGSADYSREELVAETGSAMLSAMAGISPPTIEQAAAYIDHWRKALHGDKRLVVNAAGAGQKAADWILGENSPNERGNQENEAPEPPLS